MCIRDRRRASRGASCAWTCGMGVSDFGRFAAAERAVWPIGRAGTPAPSGWILGLELNLTRHQSDWLGAPTHDYEAAAERLTAE
eukprot:8350261-Alexandrium_andersonii.AAC.1